MKKIIISSIILSSTIITTNLQAQSFEKGSLNFDLGVSIGAYATSQSYTSKTTFNGKTETTKSDTTDGASSILIPLSFEYGLSEKFGIGADLVYNNYFIDEEDDNLSSAQAFDIGAKFNYHFLNSNKNQLFVGVGLGFSSMVLDYTDKEKFIDYATGSGLYYSLGLTDRLFFSEHFGVLFNMSYKGYIYSPMTVELTSEQDALLDALDIEHEQKWDWGFNGINIGIGIAVKL